MFWCIVVDVGLEVDMFLWKIFDIYLEYFVLDIGLVKELKK